MFLHGIASAQLAHSVRFKSAQRLYLLMDHLFISHLLRMILGFVRDMRHNLPFLSVFKNKGVSVSLPKQLSVTYGKPPLKPSCSPEIV